MSKDSPNVLRLRPIGRLNYQEDLEEENGPSFFGPLELDVRREVRREQLEESDEEVMFLEKRPTEREIINE